MLWYKAWLETRTRFVVSLVGITAMPSLLVFHGDRTALSYVKAEYYNNVMAAGHWLLSILWMVAITLLMMGGLLRERAIGASSFTLALPVSRARLMNVRIVMGVFQGIMLAMIPWGVMFLVGALAGKTHSVSQAVFYVILLLGGGSLFFAIALLFSSLIEGEYTAPIASFGVAIALIAFFDGETLRRYNPYAFVMGWPYFNRQTALLVGPLLWVHVVTTLLIAAVLAGISIRAMQRREF